MSGMKGIGCLAKTVSRYRLHRLKRKQKRSASSSPSSSPSSRSSSSSSSSSSSRRRSKKKKKKKRKSEQGSRRHRRLSSRESRRSEEERGKKGGKEEEEEEWDPAPSDTSASFLNQKGGPGMEEGVEERRISQLYSLSADDYRSDSLYKGGKRRDKEQDKMKSSRNSPSRSPEKGERSNRGRDESRKDFRRSNVEENIKRRASCSSTEADNSQKVNVNQVEVRRPDRRSSCEGGRYRNRGWQELHDNGQMEKDGRQERAERESSRSGGGSSSRSEGPGASLSSAGRPRKDLPSNLLDIFSQIAQFEKEKGIKPK